MEDVEGEKPWRPADHPRPGPSWDDYRQPWTSDHRGVPDAED